MANKKISDLSAGTTVSATDKLAAWQTGTVYLTAAQLKTFVTASANTWAGAQTVNVDNEALKLQAVTPAAAVYQGFRNSTGTRIGYQGYSADSTNYEIRNEVSGGSITITTTGTGGVNFATPSSIGINNRLFLYDHAFGFSSSYRCLQLGDGTTANRNVAICIDPSTISGGNFGGTAQILIGNKSILAPNNAGTDWMGVIRCNAGKVCIGGGMTSGDLNGTGLTVDSAGVTTIAKDGGLAMVAQTSGSGSGAGTITNAPKAGNPDTWVPVTINGVLGWIPWWHA